MPARLVDRHGHQPTRAPKASRRALAATRRSRAAALSSTYATRRQPTAVVDSVIKEHGKLSVLVNNAGITRDTLAMRMKDDDWDAVLDTNLSGVFRLAAP